MTSFLILFFDFFPFDSLGAVPENQCTDIRGVRFTVCPVYRGTTVVRLGYVSLACGNPGPQLPRAMVLYKGPRSGPSDPSYTHRLQLKRPPDALSLQYTHTRTRSLLTHREIRVIVVIPFSLSRIRWDQFLFRFPEGLSRDKVDRY